MSHDLRTPLNAISGFAQLLEMDDLTPEQHDSVRQLRKSAAHLLSLINEVLDMTCLEAGHLALSSEPVAIDGVLRQVLELVRPLAAQRGIAVDDQTLAACQSATLLGDRERLTQILLNLMSNAVKYNRDGGAVRLACEDSPGGRLRIKVSDTGAGIRLLNAKNGRSGLDLILRERPDLVLLDLNLPDIDGEEVLRRLRAAPHSRAVPVVILSADATPRRVARLRAADVIAYLTKPLDVRKVLQVLDDSLTTGGPR